MSQNTLALGPNADYDGYTHVTLIEHQKLCNHLDEHPDLCPMVDEMFAAWMTSDQVPEMDHIHVTTGDHTGQMWIDKDRVITVKIDDKEWYLEDSAGIFQDMVDIKQSNNELYSQIFLDYMHYFRCDYCGMWYKEPEFTNTESHMFICNDCKKRA